MSERVPENAELDRACEVFLDLALYAVEGRDDDAVVFMDDFSRRLAEELGINAEVADIAPMTAGEVRRRIRDGKERLAWGSR